MTICETCIRVHGRDTNHPIQCRTCHKIIGCFWHNRATWHVRACAKGEDLDDAYIRHTYLETREDGWPLCPRCGEDELWSGFQWDGEGDKPPMKAWILAGLRCYKCNWSSS